MKIQTPNGWRKYHCVENTGVEGNIVYLKFHEKLKPYLLELKKEGNFTQYRLGQILMFRSFYSLRIYGILAEHYSKRIYEFEYSLEEFRKMVLGESSNSYPLYKNFRNKVIDRAKKEFSEQDATTNLYKSNLNFDLQTRRTGRKISHLIFTIKTQPTKPTPKPKKAPVANNNAPQIILDYEAVGVMRKMVQPYLDQRGEQSLRNTLNKFHQDKAAGKITKSEQGYLAYLLRVNAGQETLQDKERQLKEQDEQRCEEQEVQEQALKESFTKERDSRLKGNFS